MKNFLERIQGIQDQCINRFKKKDPALIGKISGATIRGIEGGVSFTEYRKIMQNVDDHSKDWRRFKEDPNKVVIEKNFLLNSLDLIGGFLIFRPINDEGQTYIQVSPEFCSSIPKSSYNYRLIFIAVICGILTLAALISLSFLVLLCLIIAMFVADRRIVAENKRIKKEWEENRAKHPNSLFSAASCSFREMASRGRIKASVNVNLSDCPFERQYNKMLNELAISAHQMNGRIVWLWRYSRSASSLDSLNFLYQESNLKDYRNAYIDLTLNIKSSNLVPAIETENSFIFFFDNFTEKMEKDSPRDYSSFFKHLTSQIRNESGTILKDDMFKPYVA